MLPPAVARIALLITFGRRGVFGPVLAQLGINLPFTTIAVVMAQVFVAAPFFIRSAPASFVSVLREIEEGASDLGAALAVAAVLVFISFGFMLTWRWITRGRIAHPLL